MRVEELTIEVRDANLNRVGQILPVDLVGFKAVLRFNNVGTWEIDLPVGHPVGEQLRLPGYGLIVTGPNGVILSGPTTSAENTKERGNPEGTWIITGSDDSIILGERLAYPTPSTADVTLQTSAYDSVYNVKTSTAMYGYVRRNLVSGTAPTARVVPGLTLAADTLLGTTVTKSARFNVLGELLTELAVVDGLGFDIKQQGTSLVFSVYQPVDRSLSIRMDVANNTLSKTSYGYAAPGVTRAIVAGQGQAEDRTFVEVTTSGSTSAQALWARRIENFIDQRNTNVTAELTQAGLERLAEAGNTITSVDVVPSSDTTMRPFVDWNLGDRVGVVIGGQEVASVVTQIALTIESDGVRIGATVGEPTGVDYESLMAGRQQSTARAINALERKESAPGINLITQQVKNDAGVAVTLGQAVYVSGANGTNVLVKLAQANAEATSSKTTGLLAENLAINGIGNIVTEGILGGLNTSTATTGDPVWLSPTTAGGLIFGIANKPKAPNHLVFIGFVLRAHAVNGEIYVKVQNGFELDELHDVSITSPAANQVLIRNSSNTGWINSDDLVIAGNAHLNGTELSGDGKTIVRYDDTWMRLNPDNEFGSGIYAGTGLFRTDGNFQVGSNGATLNVSPSTFTYNGKAASGLIPMVPSSVTVSGGSASFNSNGAITVSGASAFYVNGVFSNAYNFYTIRMTQLGGGNVYMYMRYSRNGAMSTSNGSYFGCSYRQGGTIGLFDAQNGVQHMTLGYASSGGGNTYNIESSHPNTNSDGRLQTWWNTCYGAGSHTDVWGSAFWAEYSNNFDGFYIYNSGNAGMTMDVQVFGYVK